MGTESQVFSKASTFPLKVSYYSFKVYMMVHFLPFFPSSSPVALVDAAAAAAATARRCWISLIKSSKAASTFSGVYK